MNLTDACAVKKIFAEIGFGNGTFLSTELEEEGRESRVPKFVLPDKIKELYIRFWVFKKVFVLSSKEGFKTRNKNRNEFKILIGIGGENVK